MNTSKSLDSILTKFMNACCDYEGGLKVDLDKEFENTVAAIVEAVEGLIGEDEPVGKFLVETREGQIAITDVEQFSFQVRNNLRSQQRKAIKEWQ